MLVRALNLHRDQKSLTRTGETWRAARSLTSQGRAEPLCARIERANLEVSEGKADLCPRSFFFLPGPGHMERRTGKIRGTFSGMHRALDGWMLAIARQLHQLKASTTMDLGISIFLILYDVWP